MDSAELRAVQEPLKDAYRSSPHEALVTLRARGELDEQAIACSVDTGRELAVAGLHPATGGDGSLLCSGDMLLQALVACAGVTLRAVATSLGLSLAGGTVTAEGDLDFRGTLAVSREAPVGFSSVRLAFDLDTEATPEQVQTLIRLTERYCVVYQTLARPPELTMTVSVLGRGGPRMTQAVDQKASAAASAATAWLTAFQQALTARDADAAATLFANESYWRDIVSFTWNITTVEGGAGVADLLRATLDEADPVGFRVTEEPAEADGVITAWIAFETRAGRGSGLLRLVDGKAFTLLTTLDELKGHEEPLNEGRPTGVRHGAFRDRVTWAESRVREAAELGYTVQPEVLIIGGGQGGIALAARLRQLGVPTIIVERNERPGDSWRKRYKSLALHDPVWYDHLPYLPFPASWPVFSPKDKIGDWLEMYAKVMELNYWGSTTCKSAVREGDGWAVTVDRAGVDGTVVEITLRPRQLVLALGASGLPSVPEVPGREKFRGDQHHSSAHPGPDKYKGKKAVVIGSNNSAHDICAALWEVGADVTMVQRSSTHVVRSDSLMDLGLSDLYSERALAAGMTTFKADTIFASLPFRILHALQTPVYKAIRERDAEFYRRLEQAGFELDFGEDDSGLFLKYLRRGSGYYIDVGASELVANGDIKLAKGQLVELSEVDAVLDDGTRLPADLVVYATGYGSMNQLAADIIGHDMADKVGKVWGLGSGTTKDPGPWEGELRNMWKPTAQEGLWFHGGNLALSRYYSLYLALQLKARMEGVPTPVYKRAEVHHTE